MTRQDGPNHLWARRARKAPVSRFGRQRPGRREAPNSFAGLGLALVLTALLTLSACSPGGPAASNVQVSSPTVNPQGQLSLHATATFEVSVQDPNGLHQAEDLRYHWSLAAERGTYLPDGDEEATEVVTTSSSLRLRGDVAGAETVRVTVVDVGTDTTVGVGTLAFDITSPSTTSLCFDTTTLVVLQGFNPTHSYTYDLETGEKAFIVSSVITDISRDGNWFTGFQTLSSGHGRIFIQRCDGTGSRSLTTGEYFDSSPKFSPDGESIYFLRRSTDENALYPGLGRAGFLELAVVDVTSGVSHFMTNLNASAQGAQEFAISPDGATIVFEHYTASIPAGTGLYEYVFQLVTMPAGGGPLQTLTNLGDNVPVYGIDWSPDGGDIIFSWLASGQTEDFGESGIYRIHPTGGGRPQLILPDPSPESLPPRGASYYAGGTRIAWSGQEYGQTRIQVWSIDANGGDVRQLTDEDVGTRLTAVWDPF